MCSWEKRGWRIASYDFVWRDDVLFRYMEPCVYVANRSGYFFFLDLPEKMPVSSGHTLGWTECRIRAVVVLPCCEDATATDNALMRCRVVFCNGGVHCSELGSKMWKRAASLLCVLYVLVVHGCVLGSQLLSVALDDLGEDRVQVGWFWPGPSHCQPFRSPTNT